MDAAIQEAIDGIGTSVENLKKENDERLKLIEKDKGGTAQYEEKLAKLNTRIDEFKDLKERLEKAEVALKRKSVIDVSDAEVKFFTGDRNMTEDEAKHRAGFFESCRAKDFSMTAESKGINAIGRKTLRVGNDPDGGYYVDPDTSGRISRRIFETSPIEQLATVVNISTGALVGFYDDDEAGFEWTESETALPTDDTTPQLGRYRIPVHGMATRPRITQELLEDAHFDFESWLMGKVADKFGRGSAEAYVNGSGDARPKGFLQYGATAGSAYERGKVERVNTGAAAAITADALVNMTYALKKAYRDRATWAMNRQTQGAVRLLKDNEDRYIWQAGLQNGQPDRLLNMAVSEFNDMPDIAAGTLPIALADWKEFYTIVKRLGMSTLRDPFTAKPFVEFYIRSRVGGAMVNSEAGKFQFVGV